MSWGRRFGPREEKASREEEQCQLGPGGCQEEEFHKGSEVREAESKERQHPQRVWHGAVEGLTTQKVPAHPSFPYSALLRAASFAYGPNPGRVKSCISLGKSYLDG